MYYACDSITCRVCLLFDTQNDKKCISLFETYSDFLIADKINAIANVGIRSGDGLPDRICPDCLNQLENALAFKNKCEHSNLILLSQINLKDDLSVEVPVKEEIETAIDDFDTYEDVLDIKPEVLVAEKPIKVYSKCNEPVQCEDCKDFFKSKCKLRIHWRKVHQPDKLTCHKCKRLFKSYRAFNIHKRKESQNCIAASKSRIEGIGKTRTFHCPECSYKTKRAKDIRIHMAIHLGERNYPCDKCPKVFTQQSSVQAHKESVHKEYKIETTCQYCGKTIKGRNKLYRHLRLHRDESAQCEICKKVVKNQRYLATHMKRHSGVKSYSCEKCAATFYTLQELCNHRTKVHSLKRYKCDICGYTLKNVTFIKAHKAKHTDTNAVCLLCGKFFENSKMLLVHQKRHFESNYPCPLCDKSFYSSKSRSSHCRAKHKCTMLKATETAKEKKIGIKQEYKGVSHYEEVITSLSMDESD